MARIATVREFAPWANVRDFGNAEQALLQDALDAAEAYAERYCGRTFSPDPPPAEDDAEEAAPVAKSFSARGRRSIRIPDLREATDVTLDDVALLASTDYYFDAYGEPATRLYLTQVPTAPGVLVVTGYWGFDSPPPDIRIAILRLGARWYHQREAQYADVVDTGVSAVQYSATIPQNIQIVFDLYRTPKLAML